MKYAIILGVAVESSVYPRRYEPMVIMVQSSLTTPVSLALEQALGDANTPAMSEGGENGTLCTFAVRVEDSVLPGDTLAKSNDVWHKATV